MSNDNNSGVNADIPPQYRYPQLFPQRSGINFIGLYRTLAKQKKIILISVLLLTLLGVVLALTRPTVYAYSTTVQMGTLDSDGKGVLIETSATALNKILSAYIPYVLEEYNQKHKTNNHYQINASVPKGSDVIVIDAKGQLSQDEVYRELINNVVNKLIEDHSRIANVRIKNLEVGIVHAENVFANTKDNAKVLATNLARLDETAQLLTTQLKEKKELMANALKNRGNIKNTNPTSAMSILLIDNEIHEYQQIIDLMEKELLIDLNKQRSDFEHAISENLRDQNDKENQIAQLKNQLANIGNTTAVVPVMRSADPVGISKSTIIIVAVLFGIIIGISLAFVLEFFQGETWKKMMTDQG